MLNKLLLDSWRFFTAHLRILAIIILPIVVPVEIFAAFYEFRNLPVDAPLGDVLLLRIPSMIAAPIYSIAVVFYIASVIQEKPLSLTAMWQLGLRYWLLYFILTLLIGMLAGLGLLIFILPGIFLLAKFAFAQFELLLNGQNPLDALKQSWQGTTGYTLTLLAGYLVIATLFLGIYLLAGLLIGALYPDYQSLLEQKSAVPIVFSLILTVVFSVLETLFTIFAFRVYDYARRQASQGTGQV